MNLFAWIASCGTLGRVVLMFLLSDSRSEPALTLDTNPCIRTLNPQTSTRDPKPVTRDLSSCPLTLLDFVFLEPETKLDPRPEVYRFTKS